MRCISLWQPWASAVALGSKRIETRHWGTKYRGPLAIHAAKRRRLGELDAYGTMKFWQGAMYALTNRGNPLLDTGLPFGAVIAVCDLVDCRNSSQFGAELDEPRAPAGMPTGGPWDWTERQMGDFSFGRYGWVFENIRALPEPIVFRGMQGFFNVPDQLFRGTP